MIHLRTREYETRVLFRILPKYCIWLFSPPGVRTPSHSIQQQRNFMWLNQMCGREQKS